MNRRTLLQALPLSMLFPMGIAQEQFPVPSFSFLEESKTTPPGVAMSDPAKVYELRIYHVVPGKLDALVARFRDHTDALFSQHGMKSVAYWTALDDALSGDQGKSNTFIYILEHPSRDAATANWKAFQDDAEWKAVKAKSEENGKLVEKIDSTFMALAEFSKTSF
jgi:hypothetical protein